MWALITCLGVLVPLVTGQDALKFLVIGDWGSGSSAQRSVAGAMGAWSDDFHPEFIVTTGDNFYDAPRSPTDSRFDTWWKNIYNNHTSLNGLKWYISVGNHDYYPYDENPPVEQHSLARHHMDDQWYFPYLWYDFRVPLPSGNGDVHFIIVDTQAMRKNMNDWRDSIVWLEDTLRQSDATWIHVFGHHPINSGARYGPGSGTIRREVQPLIEQYGADVFWCGHDHNMQHIWKEAEPELPLYLLSGSASRSMYDQDNGYTRQLENEGYTVNYFGRHAFAAVSVDDQMMTVEYVGTNGEVFHTITRGVTDRVKK